MIVDEVHERTVDADILCLLTRRLLDTQPELLNTSLNAESNCCDTLIMHRNYMETTTISVAAHNKDAWSGEMKQFYKHRNNLSVISGVLMYNRRVVIPRVLRANTTHP